MRLRSIALTVVLLAGFAHAAKAAVTIDRQFGYDNARLRVAQRLGWTAVDYSGAQRETRAGRPDLPQLSERVELPPGMKVVAMEVTDFATRSVASGAHVAPAIVERPGLGPIERSKPDPAIFSSVAAQPGQVVELGPQGDLRGHNVVTLRVSPTQWNPTTGEVDVVTRLGVRFTLEPDAAPTLRRERIVPEWEDDGLPSGVPSLAVGASIAHANATTAAGRRAQPYMATQVPSLLGSPVAYVIVTSDAMAPAFQQLADWKTQTGVPAVVRTTSFIQAQYPSAADDAERVRMFIRDAYTRWGTKWVLLGGDTGVIPTRFGYTTFYGSEMIATDLYFSCLDGNWDADGDSLFGEGFVSSSSPGDSCDLMPEVYVGRAGVASLADAQTFVNKTLQYEKTPRGDYEYNWLFAAEVLFPQPWNQGDPVSLDGGALAETLLPLTDEIPALHVDRLYENIADTTYRAGAHLETRRAVIDSMNAGPGLMLHVGHGYRNIMEVGDDALTNADAMALVNGSKLFNLYSINCTSAAIDFPCIGEAFLANPNGGAVTDVGSTRFDFPTTGSAYQYEFFREFIEDKVNAVGQLEANQKLAWIPYSGYDGANRWTQMTLILLGDPELRMWLGSPGTLAVTAPASITVADSAFTVHVTSGGTPLANARVTAYKPGADYASVVTDASGNAVVSFRPDSAGSLTLTVTAYNVRPWQSSVAIGGASAPALAVGALTVNDGISGGTTGDANGSVDAGETVDLFPVLKNQGGSASVAVSATLATTDPLVAVTTAGASYGTLAAGAGAGPATGFRVVFPYTLPDQREVPFKLVATDAAGHLFRAKFQVTVHAPDLRSFSHGETETVGNNDGRPSVGETVNYFIRLRNRGTGTAHGVSLVLRGLDTYATVTDSTSSIGNIAPGAEVSGDAVTFQVSSLAAKFDVLIYDDKGYLGSQRLDLVTPSLVTNVLGLGAATSINLTWKHSTVADLYGYNVYRSSSASGPFTKVNPYPTGRIATYTDENLTPLTRYYYEVSVVDSSGNESLLSSVVSTSTNPPTHGVFPVPMGRNTPAPVALEYLSSTHSMDITAGAEVLYQWHADGTPVRDADGLGTTLGDFTNRGSYYAGGPSVATLEAAQGWSVIGASWDSSGVYVFDKNGNLRPGFPVTADASGIWAGVACGDIDGDGKMELVWPSNSAAFYAVHDDGTEVRDGDWNPATRGIFNWMNAGYNYSTPALADIDGDGKAEIIVGSSDGNLYVWKADGSRVPGFPIHTAGAITASPAVAYLDGPGDTKPEIVFVSTSDSMFVVEPDGTPHAGFPQWTRAYGSSKTPSPAIADMNNDGYLDIVYQSTNGYLYCWDHNGGGLPHLYGVKYSTKTSGASECSPVVADIDGDGVNDIVTGDENGVLNAISGATGTVLPGFPIQLTGEVRGTPAVGDIDGDGKTEICVSDWDKNMYVWDYDFTFQPSGRAPWPQFHHDARRTGFYDSPLFVGVDDGPGAAGRPAATVEFAPPSPNPARGSARLAFGVPASLQGRTYEMAIYDLSGRRVRLVDAGAAKAGHFSVAWDLRDDARRPVAGGVYFARFTVGGASVVHKLVVLQ